MKKNLFGMITHIEDQKLEKMPLRGLYENQDFNFPFWSMIYVASKFTLSVSEIGFQFQVSNESQ